jgi:hypothetical protein
LSDHFDLQNRAISYYQALGWAVNWGVDTEDVDLTASMVSRVLLITVPGPDSSGDTVDKLVREIRWFKETHPEVEDVRGSVVIGRFGDSTESALVAAQERGVEVLQQTGQGFVSVAGT